MKEDEVSLKSAWIRDDLRARRPDLLYSLLFAPPRHRRSLLALYALTTELLTVARYPRITEMSAARLAWWRSELAQAGIALPAHPLAQALAQAAPDILSSPDLLAFVDAIADEHGGGFFENLPDLMRACARVQRPIVHMSLRVLSVNLSETVIDNLAVGLDLTSRLQDLGRGARHGHLWLPQAILNTYGLPLEALSRRPPPTALHDAILDVVSCARTHLEAVFASPAAPPHPLATQARFALALLKELTRTPLQILDTRISLAPLRMIGIAWRTTLSPRPKTSR